MLDLLIIVGGAVYAGISALRERAARERAAARLPAPTGSGAADGALIRVPEPSSAYATLDAEKADHYLRVAGAGLGLSVLTVIFPPASWLAASVLTYLALPLYKSATLGAFADHRPRSSMVGSILTVASLSSGYYVLTAGCSLAFFFSYRLMLKTRDRSGHRVARILSDQPGQVWLRYGDAEVAVPFDSLRTGDVIVLRAGELVPIDGTVVHGLASVDQRALTGESHEVEKAPGDSLLASSTVIAGTVQVRVERTGEQTRVANVQRILDHTVDYTAAMEQKTGVMCDRLAGPTLLAGGAAGLLLGPARGVALIGCNLSEVNRATTPLSMLNYLDLAAGQGMLIKDGRSLELLAGIDTVVFDKTGTLTLDQPHVGAILPLGEGPPGEAEILALAAAASHRQTHPVAKAILTAATQGGVLPPPPESARYEIGYGMKVEIGGHLVHLGSARYMDKEGVAMVEEDGLASVFRQAEDHGHSLAFLARNRRLIGVIVLHSSVRPEARRAIAALKGRGMAVYIVSGDTAAPTQHLASQLGIDQTYASVLPAEKADIIRRLRQQGRSICFVGDGINDAVALKTANVGISLCGASNAALDSAGIILMNQGLDPLDRLFDLAAAMERDRRRGYYATALPGAIGAVGVVFFGMGLPAALVLDMLGIGAAVTTAMGPVFGESRQKLPASKRSW